MTDFDYIPINTTAKKIEKIANTEVLTEEVKTENDNAIVSATALLKTLGNEISLWEPYTKYKVGDLVIATWENDDGKETVIAECNEAHTSSSSFTNDIIIYAVWDMKQINAYGDEYGRRISEIYATKEELENIATALDGVIAAQLEFLGEEPDTPDTPDEPDTPVEPEEPETSGDTGNCTWKLNGTTLTISAKTDGDGAMEDYDLFGEYISPWREDDITEVIIEDGVTHIGSSAFLLCESLTSITIPNSVTSINRNAFSGCTSLTDVYYKGSEDDKNNIMIGEDNDSLDSATWHYAEPDEPEESGTTGNCTWSLDGTVLTISGNSNMGDYDSDDTLPWGTNITKVIINGGVTSIGANAFKGCSSLINITIPVTIIYIGGLAFNGCSSLTNVTIPQFVTTIKSGTFQNCSSLTSVTIPVSVKNIETFAFNGCTALTTVNYRGSEADKDGMTIVDDGNNAIKNATWNYNYAG